MVLCGGRGTRLQSAVCDVPKALAPINNTPFLSIQLDNWLRQGIEVFDFLLGYKSDLVIQFLDNEQQRLKKLNQAISFSYVVESKPLDTGGAIANAVHHLDISEDFLVINADTWLSAGVGEMIGAISPAIGIVKVDDPKRFGTVDTDSALTVTGFIEKSAANHDGGWINAGISKLSPEAFYNWNGEPLSLERDVYPKLVTQASLKAIRLNAKFTDIGVPADYMNFCRKFEEIAE